MHFLIKAKIKRLKQHRNMSQYAVCIYHTIFVSFRIIFHVPACYLYGQHSQRRMSVRVLGY